MTSNIEAHQVPAGAPSTEPRRQKGGRRRRWSTTGTVGAVLVGAVVVIGVVSLFYLPYPAAQLGGGRLAGPSAQHLLGTDALGRDLLSQFMVGARIALLAGAGSAALGGTLGIVVGLAAAFWKTWADDGAAAVLDVLIAFPSLLLAMLVVAARGATLGSAILAIGLAIAAIVARLTRILAKRVLGRQFVLAARTSGTGWFGIIRRHILPNIWPTLAVIVALQFGLAVLAEASLSYLGLGAPPPNASWGSLLHQAQGTVYVAPLGAIMPGIGLVVLVLGVNLLADGMQDAFDPVGGRR
ncbi:MAG TPA: ABC transporter permease [Microbacteriaceae bacterium]|nr:ABC transporter permease [Microbacteriaceae bacterium]